MAVTKQVPAVCRKCGWPAISVGQKPRLVDGVCFYCRSRLWVGVKPTVKAKGEAK